MREDGDAAWGCRKVRWSSVHTMGSVRCKDYDWSGQLEVEHEIHY